MRISVISVGKIKDKGVRKLSEDYRGRLSHHLKAVDLDVSKVKRGDSLRIRKEEGEALLQALPEGALVVAMTEEGKKLSSYKLAEEMQRWLGDGVQDVAFLVGGAHGLSEEVKKSAHLSLSLSAMTFPHDIARMLLWEQLYRAMTILRGEPYHK